MAKSKTTPHTTSFENSTENVLRNTGHRDTSLSKGWIPNSEEHALCQEAQEGPEEEAGQQCEGLSAVLRPSKPL